MQMKFFYSEKARLVTLCELPSVQKKLVAGAVITSVLQRFDGKEQQCINSSIAYNPWMFNLSKATIIFK